MPVRTYTKKGGAVVPGTTEADVAFDDTLAVGDVFSPRAGLTDSFEASDSMATDRVGLADSVAVSEAMKADPITTTMRDSLAVADPAIRPSLVLGDSLAITEAGLDPKVGLLDTTAIAEAALVPKVVLADALGAADSSLNPRLAVGDGLSVTDDLSLKVGPLDSVAIFEPWLAPVVVLKDTAGAADFARFDLREVAYGASGTPDTDPGGDAETVENVPTSNFGSNAVVVVQADTAIGGQERRGYIEFDLTSLANFTAVAGGTQNVRLMVSLSGLVTATLEYDLRRVATRPFVESLVTWNNPPTLGTSVETGTITVSPGGPTAYLIPIPDADVTDLLGDWFLVILTDTDTVLRPTFTVESRQAAVAANRPQLNLTLRR